MVEVPGLARKLLPAQAYTVYWALQQFEGVAGSVFVGHVMGLGKTTIAFALCLVRHKLNSMHHDIRIARESHCPHDDSSPTASCPLNEEVLRRYGHDCPCAPSSPTHFTQPTFGFSLVLVPQSLLKVWMDEGAACFPPLEQQNPFQMQLMKAHGAESLRPDQLYLLRVKRGRSRVDNTGHPIPPHLEAQLANSRCIVLTTSHSFASRVQELLMQKYADSNSARFFSAVVALAIRDEFHVEKNQGSKSIQVLQEIQTQARRTHSPLPCLACLSGTPLTSGPSDIAQYVQLMRRTAWADHPVLRCWREKEAITLGANWDADCRKGQLTAEVMRECITRFQPLVQKLMIRFTARTNFLGVGPVVREPRNVYCDVWAQLDAEWEARLAQQKTEEDQRVQKQEAKRRQRYSQQHRGNMTGYQPLLRTRANLYYRARLYASFPALMDLTDEDGDPLRLTEEEWSDKRTQQIWTMGTETDPYFRERHQIFASSAKLRELRRIWQDWEHRRDAYQQPARLIFCSYFFVGAYLMFLVGLSPFACPLLPADRASSSSTTSWACRCLNWSSSTRPSRSPSSTRASARSSTGKQQTAAGRGCSLRPRHRLGRVRR